MIFSKRTEGADAENKWARARNAKKKQGIPVLDLTESNPTRCGFSFLDETVLQALSDRRNLLYQPDPRGLLSARREVAGYYESLGVSVSPEDIFLTSSTSEAYSFIFRLLFDPGRTVGAPSPGYPLLDELASLHDLRLERYPLVYDNKWRIQPQTFREVAAKRGCAGLVFVHPNNPTGNYLSAEDRNLIDETAGRKKIPLILDEVFLDFDFVSAKANKSLAGRSDTLQFTLSGLSKILGLPQMKLSWIVVGGPEPAKREALKRLERIADTFLSVNAPAQNALPFWMSRRETIVREICQRLTGNRNYLEEKLKTVEAARLLNARGGWYAVLKLKKGYSDEDTSIRLLERQNILTHPGYLFDFPEGDYLVLSLLPPPSDFQRAIDLLYDGLK